MRAVTPNQMKAIEEASVRLGVSRLQLMENAGRGLAEYVEKKVGKLDDKHVVVLAGSGNNGGDGFVAARHLAGGGSKISVILLAQPKNIKTEEARANWSSLSKMTETVKVHVATDAAALGKLYETVMRADVILDAVFGTGIKGRLKDPQATAVDLINEANGLKVAVDIPSGLDPLSGSVEDKFVRPDATVTFHRPKTGLTRTASNVGELIVAPIGIPPEADSH